MTKRTGTQTSRVPFLFLKSVKAWNWDVDYLCWCPNSVAKAFPLIASSDLSWKSFLGFEFSCVNLGLLVLLSVFIMTNYILFCTLTVKMCYVCWGMCAAALPWCIIGGWVTKKCFLFRNSLKAPSQSWGFIYVLCCTTEISAMPFSFVDHTMLVAVISEKDFVALCNSWSRLCCSDILKEEILNLHRK